MVSELNISNECRRIVLDRMIDERNKLKYSFVDGMDVDTYYSVDAMPWEYESNKIWQLYVQCKNRYDHRVYQFLEECCNQLVEGLYAEKLERPQMETLINLIPPMQEMGWKTDGRKLLEAYYNHISWTSELNLMKYLRPCCPEYYDEFMVTHFDEIRERLPLLILEDIEYYLDEWDGDARIDDLIGDAPILFREYGIEFTKDYEKMMYDTAEREVPSKRVGSLPKEIYEAEEKYMVEQQNYKDATKQAEAWFMPKIQYLSPRKIKETERAFGKDYRRGWLTKGKFTEDDFMLVMEYLGRLPEVPRTEQEFYEGLTAFLTDQCTVSEKQFLYVIARKLIEQDLFYFTEQEAARYSGIDEKQMEKMTACGIVHRTGRWYHFWNQRMMLYLASCSIREMSDMEKESYYRKDMWENWFSAQESEWVKYLVQNDSAVFEKYLVRPNLSRFLADIPGRSGAVRAEWLMREMEWEWQIGTRRLGIPYTGSAVFENNAEIFDGERML